MESSSQNRALDDNFTTKAAAYKTNRKNYLPSSRAAGSEKPYGTKICRAASPTSNSTSCAASGRACAVGATGYAIGG